MGQLSSRVGQIRESKIREIKQKAAGYDDLIHLEIGDPDTATPEFIIDAACKASRDGHTGYSSSAGMIELREALSNDIKNRYGTSVSPDAELTITTGASEAVHLTMMAIVDPGDEVMVPTPTWHNYFSHINAVGGEFVDIPLDAESHFPMDPDRIEERITRDSKAIIFSCPCNPTGVVYDRDDIETVVDLADSNDMFVVFDEAYDTFIYDDAAQPVFDYVGMDEHIIYLNSFSKRFAMTGWRLGWIMANEDIINASRALHSASTSCPPTISQYAALEGLTGDQSYFEAIKEKYRRRRSRVMELVADMEYVTCPDIDGGFYAFLNMERLDMDDERIAEILMSDYGVLAVPGSGFGRGGTGHLRISFASADVEQLEAALTNIERMTHDYI